MLLVLSTRCHLERSILFVRVVRRSMTNATPLSDCIPTSNVDRKVRRQPSKSHRLAPYAHRAPIRKRAAIPKKPAAVSSRPATTPGRDAPPQDHPGVTLYAHQRSAKSRILQSIRTGDPGSILCHRMGMGKSMTTLSVMHSVLHAEPARECRILVVVPVNVLPHWKTEASRLNIRVRTVHGPDWREQFAHHVRVQSPRLFVVLTTHGTLQSAYVQDGVSKESVHTATDETYETNPSSPSPGLRTQDAPNIAAELSGSGGGGALGASSAIVSQPNPFEQWMWNMVVLDEVHRFVNYNKVQFSAQAKQWKKTLYSRLYKSLRRRYTLAISGTPLTNEPISNAKALLQLLRCNLPDERPPTVRAVFKKHLVEHRGKLPSGCTFPSIRLEKHWCDRPSPDSARLSTVRATQSVAPPVEEASTSPATSKNHYVANRLWDTTGCRTSAQVDQLSPSDIRGLPKYRQILRMVRNWQRNMRGHEPLRVVVVAEFTSLLRCVSRILPAGEYYGDHSTQERASTLAWFRDPTPDTRILCLSLACEGLNLGIAKHMILLHPSDSFVREQQAMYRICRMCGHGSVQVHFLYTRDGKSDPSQRRRQYRKLFQLESVFPEYGVYRDFLKPE